MPPKDTRMAPPPTDPLAVELARFEADRARSEQATIEAQKKLHQLEAQGRQERREFIGAILIGIAVVAVILGIVAAIWHANVSRNWTKERIEAERTEQMRGCMDLGDPTERQLCIALLGQEPRES